MVRPAEEILAMYEDRQRFYGADLMRIRVMQTLMNNEMPVPLPELSTDERSLVANLALTGMNQLAQRIASVEPTYYWPSLSPGSKAADARATNRRRVTMGWHEANDSYRIRSKRARQFLAWATAPVVIMPDTIKGSPTYQRPKWQVLNPLTTFIPPGSGDTMIPQDVISVSVYTYQDLINIFGGELANSVTKPPNWDWQNDYKNMAVEFEVLQYIDSEEISLILVGHATDPRQHRYGFRDAKRTAVRIAYAPNLAGRPLCVVPSRICLDAQLGHYDGIVGMYQAQAALMTLMVIAQRRAVWPKEWIESHPQSQEEPEITQDPDQYRGIPGIISNGRLTQQNLDPSFRAFEVMDRQEEATRKEAGIPEGIGGIAPRNIRSGAQARGMISASIDFTISEAQQVFARSFKEENKIAIAIDKAYFPQKKVFFIETRSYYGALQYKPSELWETDSHIVDYPIAGTDLQSLPIEGGQRVQMETLSRFGFMEVDPLIKDPEAELQRMDREALKRAFLNMLQVVSSQPSPDMRGIQPEDLAVLDQQLEAGEELLPAFIKLNNDIKKRQAQAAANQGAGAPSNIEGNAVSGMPGTATTQGAPEGEGPIPQPPESLQRFTQLLGSLGTSQAAARYR